MTDQEAREFVEMLAVPEARRTRRPAPSAGAVTRLKPAARSLAEGASVLLLGAHLTARFTGASVARR